MTRAPESCEISRGARQIRQARTEQFSICEARYEPGVEIPPHYHEYPCITFVLDGGFIEKTDRAQRDVDAQTLLLKPAAEIHSDQIARRGAHSIHIELVAARNSTSPLVTLLCRPILCKATTVTAIASDILHELKLADAMSEIALEGLAVQLIAEGARSQGNTRPPCPRDQARPKWLDHTVEYLHDTISGRPSLSQAAHLAGVHPSHLSRMFRRHFGCSIGQYLRSIRVEKVAELLRTTSQPIGAIAEACGFSDQSHLSKVFKNAMGSSPAHYRRSHSRR